MQYCPPPATYIHSFISARSRGINPQDAICIILAAFLAHSYAQVFDPRHTRRWVIWGARCFRISPMLHLICRRAKIHTTKSTKTKSFSTCLANHDQGQQRSRCFSSTSTTWDMTKRIDQAERGSQTFSFNSVFECTLVASVAQGLMHCRLENCGRDTAARHALDY